MDLRVYYAKVREVEAGIQEEFPLVVSLETGDGGKAGTRTEVPRRLAAKMTVEGQARLATAPEASAYRESLAEAHRVLEQAAAAARVQLSVLSTSDLNQLKNDARKHAKE
jgi:fermentation-respiration switch protein FrsA (DUF1100 family)